MTTTEIINMARDAGFWQEHTNTWMCSGEDLTSFAALVRNAALEEAAVVCEAIGQEANLEWRSAYRTLDQGIERGADDCADTIRKLKENQMTDLRKAAQQALEALSDCIEKFYAMRSIGVIDALPLQAVSGAQAITALRAALAQPDVANAMSTVVAAMQADPDYAWSWHCNIAMAFVDAGGDSYTANQGAARFMRTLAQVEPAHELPAQPDVQEPVTKTGKAYVDNLIDALLLPIAAMTASDLEELHCRCADMLLMYATPALAQPDVPKGWVLVPVEPTPEMWKAVSQFAHAGSVWDAMLAAAPKGGA